MASSAVAVSKEEAKKVFAEFGFVLSFTNSGDAIMVRLPESAASFPSPAFIQVSTNGTWTAQITGPAAALALLRRSDLHFRNVLRDSEISRRGLREIEWRES